MANRTASRKRARLIPKGWRLLFAMVVLSACFPLRPSPAIADTNGAGSRPSPKISERLEARLEAAGAFETMRVLIRLKGTDAEPEAAGAEGVRLRRHRTRAIESLKERARDEGVELFDRLEGMRKAREARRPGSRWLPRRRTILPGEASRRFWISNCIAATVTPQEVEQLAEDPQVAEIVENVVLSVPPLSTGETSPGSGVDLWNHEAIGLDALTALGLRGTGVRVGHLDTGLSLDTPELTGKLSAWAEFDALGEAVESAPHETHPLGHGTHVASVIAGETVGLAPGVSLLSALVLPGGNGTLEQVLAGMQWVLDPDGDPATDDGAHIVNMSWGMLEMSPVLSEAVDNMIDVGALPVAAIGNSVVTTFCPGNVPDAIGVGAVAEDDLMAPYSGGGTVCWGNYCVIKPDICAPGTNVWGAQPGGGYRLISGTSAAAPHVSGAAALLLEYAGLDLLSLKSFLLNSAFDLGYPGHDYKFGRGRLDLARALSFTDAYLPRLGARDLVFETVRELFAGLRLPSYHTCFSDGETGPEASFQSLRVLPDCLGATLRTLGLGDVNGDGSSDLLLSRTRPLDSGAYETEHWLYRGGEPSGFSEHGSVCYTRVSEAAEPCEVTGLADVNGDGKADLVLRRTEADRGIETTKVSVLLAGENGTLTGSSGDWSTVTAYDTFRIDMKVGDVNGDGRADLVFSKEYENAHNMYPVFFYACLSDGEGFQPPTYWYVLYLSSYPLGAQGGMSFLDLSDVTGDGFADLVFSCDLAGYKGIYACPSNGHNGFLSSRLWAGIDLDDRVEAIVDVNGDQAADLVFSSEDGSSPGRVLRRGLSDGRSRFLTNGDVWFDPNSAGLPPDWTLAGVADVGLGSWQ